MCRDCTLPEIFLHGSSILICDFVILRDAIALSLCELNIQLSTFSAAGDRHDGDLPCDSLTNSIMSRFLSGLDCVKSGAVLIYNWPQRVTHSLCTDELNNECRFDSFLIWTEKLFAHRTPLHNPF